MDFGSTYVYLEPSISDINVASGIQPESAKISALTNAGLEEKAEALAAPLSTKVGATLTYKDAVLDIKNVYNLTEHVVDWFGLGTQLEITDSRLKKIRLENETEDGRRREMIVSWLYGDPEASWQKLSKALVRIDHRVLANKIDREILPLLQHGKRLRDGGHRADSAQNQVQLQHAVSRGLGNMKKGAPLPAVTGRSLSLEPKESAMVNFVDGECDADSFNPPSPQIPERKCEDKDTNILMIKFGALSKPCKVHTGDPIICSNSQCAAILNYHSKITKETEGQGNVWICEFCSTKNTIEIEAGEIPKEGDILYLQQPQHSSKHDTLVSGITKDSIVVFCVDTSGSMGVTTEVPGKKELKGYEKVQKLKEIYAGSGIQYMPGQYRNVTYISRLQCVQAAIDHQLTALARNNPSQRVAIVMFGDEVTVTGDGRPENEFVFVGEKLWKENVMLKLIENIPTPSPIRESRGLLNEKIFSIEEEGQTALGGALLVSVELAKRAPGSKVILCTDGLANRGIGNLDDEKCIESSIAFYKKLGIAAKESSVSVSVLTIKGTDCDLLHLGEVANLSGGNVEVVDPMSLSEEFVNILSTSVVAVHVNAKIVLHSTLSFKDGDGKNTLSVPVGNVVDTTKLMYEFSSSEKNAGTGDHKELHEVPFQVQIKYTSLDGQQCLRVFTEARPTTSDKGVANQGAKSDVLMAYTLNKEGNSILQMPARNLPQACAYSVPPILRSTYIDISVDEVEFGTCRKKKRRKSHAAIRDFENSSSIHSSSEHQCYMPTSSLRSLLKTVKNHKQHYDALHQRLSQYPIGKDADEMAATAFQQIQGKMEPSQCTVKVQKHITLTNEGYGFGFLLSPGKEGGTVVQSLVPNGVAWKDGELQKDDKILTINGECVEKMDHQDVVKKLRLLNDEATNSITLCVVREEVCQGTSSTMKDHAEDTKLLSVNLQSNGPNSVGLTFKFDDSEYLIIEVIKPDGIAAKDGRLKGNDTVLEINGEAVSGKTDDDISAMVKNIEESDGSMELLVRRKIPVSLRAHNNTKLSHRKPPVLKSLPSWSQPSLQTPMPKLNPIMAISLHNQGYGFGFTVQETEDKSIVVSTVFPEGIAHKDGRLRANDKLIEIGGRKVSDMTYKEVIAMLRALNEDDHSVIDLKVERKV